MTIQLPKDLERFVQSAVLAGRYANEGEVISDALTRLKQALPEAIAKPARRVKDAVPAGQETKPLTRAEFDQHLLKLGLLSQLPNTDADFDDPEDEPVEIKGEPLSETVIRERR